MLLFIFKLSLCWGFFALLYWLLLRQETFFRANRAYLLGAALLSIGLSAIEYEVSVPAVVNDQLALTLPDVDALASDSSLGDSAWQSTDYVRVIWFLGIAFMLLRLVAGIGRIVMTAVRGHTQILDDGTLLVHSEEIKSPFSFFRWVFIPHADQNTPNALVIAHECAHARGWHSADVIAMELLCAVFWFHPLAQWYRRELRTVHEFLADAEVARRTDKKQYGLLLIQQSQFEMPIALANHFFQSPLKQRLIMLMKQHSAPVRALKFALALPLTLLFVVLFRQAPVLAQNVDPLHLARVHRLEAQGWLQNDTVVTFEEEVKIIKTDYKPYKSSIGEVVYQVCETPPQFPGGPNEMYQFLGKNIKYPAATAGEKREGKVIVRFAVSKNGSIKDVRIHSNDQALSKAYTEEAARVIQAMPAWTPGRHKGKTVACDMLLPIQFKLE